MHESILKKVDLDELEKDLAKRSKEEGKRDLSFETDEEKDDPEEAEGKDEEERAAAEDEDGEEKDKLEDGPEGK